MVRYGPRQPGLRLRPHAVVRAGWVERACGARVYAIGVTSANGEELYSEDGF